MPVFPESHLKTGGNVNVINGKCNAYSDAMNKDSVTNESEDRVSKQLTNREADKRSDREEDVLALVSKLEDPKGSPLEVPQYKVLFYSTELFYRKFQRI